RAGDLGRRPSAPRAGARPRRGEAAVLDPIRRRAALRLRGSGAARLPRPAPPRLPARGGALRRARLRPRAAHDARRHPQAAAEALSPSPQQLTHHIRSVHHVVTADDAALQRALHVVTDRLAEPVGDPALLPTYLLAEAAQADVKVVLSGEGADELFGGYPTY